MAVELAEDGTRTGEFMDRVLDLFASTYHTPD